MPAINFYYRNGCHLCEEMAAVLHQSWPDQFTRMVWLDVDANPEGKARFGHLVPVLAVDGEVLSALVLDAGKVEARFGSCD